VAGVGFRVVGNVKNPEIKFKDSNPSCGDEIEIEAKIENGIIKEIKFNGKGCAISLASAELLTQHLKGKKIEEIKNISREEALDLIKINLSPLRIKCVLLSLKVFKYGLYNYMEQSLNGEEYE
jgi:nitrogen fixation NifU-like protein